MDRKMKVTYEIEPDELREILREYFKKEHNIDIDDIDFNVTHKVGGQGYGEYDYHAFTSVELVERK